MKIELIKGDITEIKVDAIVNAANSSLLGGGGVDGAIHRKGGKDILNDCLKIRNSQGGCKTGEAVITSAGNLPAKQVIHTVGPVYQEANSKMDDLLAQCYKSAIELLLAHNLKTIAFPNISTGIYRFPKDRAAEIAIRAIKEYDQIGDLEVLFVCFDQENYDLYRELLK
ncbi:MAG: O-acetyl-ADP-ribose deacetylase [Bacteroidota bacterium]